MLFLSTCSRKFLLISSESFQVRKQPHARLTQCFLSYRCYISCADAAKVVITDLTLKQPYCSDCVLLTLDVPRTVIFYRSLRVVLSPMMIIIRRDDAPYFQVLYTIRGKLFMTVLSHIGDIMLQSSPLTTH